MTTRIDTDVKRRLLDFFVRSQPYFAGTEFYKEYCELYELVKPRKSGRPFGWRKYKEAEKST